MKNVSKKLFSLVLAAVLLLSVVPFQALAAEVPSVTVRVRINQDNNMVYTQTLDTEWDVGMYISQAAHELGMGNAAMAGEDAIMRVDSNGSWVKAGQSDKLGESDAYYGVIDIDVALEESKPEQPEQKPEETKPEETKPEETKPEDKGDIHFTVSVYDASNKNKKIESLSYSSVAPYGTKWDLYDTQNTLDSKGYYISRFVVAGEDVTNDLTFTVNKEGMKIEVYATKRNDSSEETKPEDEKPVDPKEKTEVIIKVYEHKGNKKVDTIYYTGKRGNIVDLDKIVNKYVIRQYRYEGKSTNSRIKLRGEEMEIVAIMDEDQGDMCTVTFRVHFKNATQKETYKFKSGTEIDIGKILVEDDVIESVKEIEKIYLRGIHVNKNNNIVTVKRSGTYDVYTDEKPYDSEDHGYPSYDKDEDLDKNAGKATLKFYLKKDMQKYTKPSAVKTITISNTAALDSKVTLQEVKKLAANYFKAENSEGIDFGDGLYIQEEYDNAKDVWDSTDGVDVFYNVNAMRNDGDVTFFVVLDNVKSVSSGSNADSSNPKTGDSIFVAVTVMAVSSLALGAAYVLNKKRMAR